MAKRRHNGEQELPFVALMDTMTNVVGVLIIVLVMVGITLASSVHKILSDLPPVTIEVYDKLKKLLTSTPKPDIQKIDQDHKKAEQALAIAVEALKTLDLSQESQKVKFVDLEALRRQITARKMERDAQKAENDRLQADLSKALSQLDQTPEYVPPAATVIRLPNPRPYPAKPNETRVMVARQGAIFFNQADFLSPIVEGLEKTKSQMQYQALQYEPFAPLLEVVLGSKAAAVAAWPKIGGLVNTFQMEQVALAYKALSDAGAQPTKQFINELGDISVGLGQQLPVVAEAVAATMSGNFAKWLALDPGLASGKPVMKAVQSGAKINFAWGSLVKEVRASPPAIQDYFKDLAKISTFKERSKPLMIYDRVKLEQALQRAAANPFFSKGFAIKPTITPGNTYLQLELSPAAGGGESLEQMKQPNSNYQRLLRQIKGDASGVVVFQVMLDAVNTYHEVRRIADDLGVPATWEFLAKLDVTLPLTTFQVQRMTPVPKPKPVVAPTTPTVPPVVIKAPPKSLD